MADFEPSILLRVLDDLVTTPSSVLRHFEVLRTLDEQVERTRGVLSEQQEALIEAMKTRRASEAATVVVPSADASSSAPPSPKRMRIEAAATKIDDVDAEILRIKALQQQCMDKSEEKIAIVRQVLRTLDDSIERIDADILT